MASAAGQLRALNGLQSGSPRDLAIGIDTEKGEIDPATAAASPDRLTDIRRYRGWAGSSFPFLPRRSALIPSRTLMHGSPWLRASEATRVRRRQINGLDRLGRAIGVLIGVLEFALGKIGVL